MIMKAQLEGEEKTMRGMVSAMQRQALLEKAEAEAEAKAQALANIQNSEADHVEGAQPEREPEPARIDKNA